ncbi:MAG: response regulator [Acidimicrobiia bacterium]
MTRRAVIAEDHLLMRRGIVDALVASGGVDVVEECATQQELLDAVERHRPDLVVTDIRMPPTHTNEGIEAARRIRGSFPGIAVIVLSHHAEPEYAMALFADGSDRLGYLLKENIGDLDQIRRSIATVCDGGSSIDPAVVSIMVSRRPRSLLDELSPREEQVLALIAEGLNNAAIAARLVIGEKSVQKHINTIFAKLQLTDEPDVHRRVQAVRLWLARLP